MGKFSFNVFVISILVLGLLSSPLSHAQTGNDDAENITIELEESISITSENPATEDTETKNTITNLGQAVSKFVHESRELFEQQKMETKEVIAQCREDMRNTEPSERNSVKEKCKSDLKEIREAYKALRETYRETFKEFRENMKIFIQEYKGLPITPAQRNEAISNIESISDNSDKKEKLRELKQKIADQIREDKQKLREDKKLERETIRESQKEDRKALKAEQKLLKEQEKEERKAQKDAIQAQDKTLDDDLESSEDKIENELEIEVEVENGVAKVKVESNGEEFEFVMEWIDEQNTISEIASKTGLIISQIEEVIEFEIESDDSDDKEE